MFKKLFKTPQKWGWRGYMERKGRRFVLFGVGRWEITTWVWGWEVGRMWSVMRIGVQLRVNFFQVIFLVLSLCRKGTGDPKRQRGKDAGLGYGYGLKGNTVVCIYFLLYIFPTVLDQLSLYINHCKQFHIEFLDNKLYIIHII